MFPLAYSVLNAMLGVLMLLILMKSLIEKQIKKLKITAYNIGILLITQLLQLIIMVVAIVNGGGNL